MGFTFSGLGLGLSDITEARLAEDSWEPMLMVSICPALHSHHHLQESPGAQALWSWAPRMPCLWPPPSLSMSMPTSVAITLGMLRWGTLQTVTGKQGSLRAMHLESSRDSL